MTYNPFRDAKFLTALLDTIFSLALYFVGRYAPGAEGDVKFVILAIQPIAALLIVGFYQRDQAAIRAGAPLAFLSKK